MPFKGLTMNTRPDAPAHIGAEDDAILYQSMLGMDGVFEIGSKFKQQILSNNKIRISDGVISVQGHIGRIVYGDYVDLTIENGMSGQNRHDLIIAKFVSGGTEDTYTIEVKKGTPGTAATDPELIQENLYEGGRTYEMPLYRVVLTGLNISRIDKLYTDISNVYHLRNLVYRGNEYKDITKDFDSGKFSENLEKYNAGNYIKKTYNGSTYVAVLADYDTFFTPYDKKEGFAVPEHHWTVIVFGFPAGKMNDTDTTDGGYIGSKMHKWLTTEATEIVKGAFGTNHLCARKCVLSKGKYVAPSTTTPNPVLYGFNMEFTPEPIYLVLPSEAQLGYRAWSLYGLSTTEAFKQLEIFRNENFMSVFGRNYGQSNNNFIEKQAWLRDIPAHEMNRAFCYADSLGFATFYLASQEIGRYPLAVLK